MKSRFFNSIAVIISLGGKLRSAFWLNPRWLNMLDKLASLSQTCFQTYRFIQISCTGNFQPAESPLDTFKILSENLQAFYLTLTQRNGRQDQIETFQIHCNCCKYLSYAFFVEKGISPKVLKVLKSKIILSYFLKYLSRTITSQSKHSDGPWEGFSNSSKNFPRLRVAAVKMYKFL